MASRERDMRKPLIFGLILLGMAVLVSAHQRAALSPSVAPVVLGAAPPSGAVAGNHVAPVHAPQQVHPGTHGAAAGVRPAVSHKTPNRPAPPRPVLPPVSVVSPVSSIPFVSSCNLHPTHPRGAPRPCQTFTGILLPFFGGAFYVPVSYVSDSATQEDVQENASTDPSEANDPQESAEEPPSYGSAPPRAHSDSLNDAFSEFVFVQRDGSTFYAVAYSLLKDKVQYVTRDGVRRTLALDSLDFNATQKFNEERGNTIHLPDLPASGVAWEVPPTPLR